MESSETERDEPLTPAGRLFLRPEMNQVINTAFGLQNSLDTDFIKTQVLTSVINNPRFSSLLVYDTNGVEHWRKSSIEIDRHVVILDNPVSSPETDDESAVNNYLADLSTSSPLETSKPLWEIHFLKAHKCLILRVHHALGDGISLMSMVLAGCRMKDDADAVPTVGVAAANRRERIRGWMALMEFLKWVWFNLVFIVEFVMRAFWVCDRRTAISGGDGVELWPRKMATARFSIVDMKAVKKAIPNATINDVLFGVISSGLSRYLDHRAQNGLQEGLQITGVAMVNLRKQPALQYLSNVRRGNSGPQLGNKFGMLLLPVYYHKAAGADPLQYLKRAKVMIDRKKQSLEAHFSYKIGAICMSCFGSKVASWLNYKIVCNTSFTISNVVGPQQEIMIGENPITYVRVTSSGLPHALTMHMLSYAGRADMQILVAKDIIPDPEFLANCFENALLEMKEAAAAMTTAL